MYSSLILPAVLAASANAVSFSWLQPRGVNEVWGGFNITDAALTIRGSISSPTCNATESCVAFVNTVVPQCLRMQGDAGCWCNLHDPLHYCALCMSNPTDNTTSAQQTQSATDGHTNYHRGCGAYQAWLNATAAGSGSTTLPAASATLSASPSEQNSGGSSFGTGPLVGVIIGGIAGVVIIIAATFLIYRKMKNKSGTDAQISAFYPNGTGGTGGGIQPHYTGGGAGPMGETKTPYQIGATPPPPPFVTYSAQPMSPATDYNPRESAYTQPSGYGPVPTTAHSETGSQPGGHSAGFHSPPPPFVANPGVQDYDTSMLTGLQPQGGKFGRAAEPM